jgi:hypothetical protein
LSSPIQVSTTHKFATWNVSKETNNHIYLTKKTIYTSQGASTTKQPKITSESRGWPAGIGEEAFITNRSEITINNKPY